MGAIVTETKKSWELKFSVLVAWTIFAFSLTKMSVTGSKSSKSLPVESKDLFVPSLSDLAQGILFDLYSGDFVSFLYKKNYFDHHFSFFLRWDFLLLVALKKCTLLSEPCLQWLILYKFNLLTLGDDTH